MYIIKEWSYSKQEKDYNSLLTQRNYIRELFSSTRELDLGWFHNLSSVV